MYRQEKRKRSQSSERSRTRHKHKSKKSKEEKRRRSGSQDRGRHKHERAQIYKRRNDQAEARGMEGRYMEQRQSMKNEKEEIIKETPCWQPSGILLQFYNSREGVSLKFHQPPQSRSPIDVWRVYIFKGDQVFQPILLTNSCYLMGKDERVCDILCQNQSISRQHAVIQFRLTVKHQQDGSFLQQIKPYLMDLESTNGTFLNGQRIQSSRYIQLLQKDVLKFGFSEREYVMVREEGRLRQKNDVE